MKKYFLLLAAAAAIFAVSCQREQTQVSENPTQTVIDDSVPAPVSFGTRVAAVKSPIATKGVGGLDAWLGPNQDSLYVYGLERGANGWVATTWKGVGANGADLYSPFIDNVAAEAPNPGNGSRDLIAVYNKWAVGGLTAQEPFYYAEDKVYDFFGYYIDDVTDSTLVDKPMPKINDGTDLAEGGAIETIVIPGMYLDGTQDIMLAQTDKEIDWALRSEYINIEKVYSAKAARRNVHPDLIFEHQLSRFEFRVIKGGNVDSQKITIDTVAVMSKYIGDLTVVGQTRGFEAQEDSTYFLLHTDAGTVFDQTEGVHPTDVATKIGESILVVPGQTKYGLKLNQTQTGVTAPGYNPATQNLVIDITQARDTQGNLIGATVAEAGKKYVVTIVVYGLEEVKISVTLTPWDFGGEITIDEDQDDPDNRGAAEITVSGLDANDNKLHIDKGETLDLLAGTTPVLSSENKAGLWTFELTDVNPASCVEVTDKGVLKGVAVGTAKLHVNLTQSSTHLAAEEKVIDIVVDELILTPIYIKADDKQMKLKDARGAWSTVAFGATFFTTDTFDAGTEVDKIDVGQISYAVTDGAGVVIVDKTTGVITAKQEGTAKVTIYVAANDTYLDQTKEITVTVTDANLSNYTIEINGGNAIEASIAAGTLDLDGMIAVSKGADAFPTAAITLSLDANETLATLAGTVLTLYPSAVSGNTITVNYEVAADGNYRKATGTLTVNVVD